MTNRHTVKRMKTEALLPKIADRHARESWEKKGSPDAQVHAMQRAREILTKETPDLISPEIDAQIRAEFIGLVSGKLELPEGW